MTANAATAASGSAVRPGSCAPLGAAVRPDGVNFTLFSKHATLIELLLFDDGEAAEPPRQARVARHRAPPSGLGSGLAFDRVLQTLRSRFLLHGMLNAYWEALTFELSPCPDDRRHGWRRCIDTFLPSPHDIQRWPDAPAVTESRYTVQPRSVVVLAMALAAGTTQD